MTALRFHGALAGLGGSVALLVAASVGAVELHDLKGLEGIYGRCAPGGDCSKQPQALVDVTGLTFFTAGKQEKVTNPEQALEYAGPDYQGSDVCIFPFRLKDGYSILMTFNEGSKIGSPTIAPQDEGYPGGPGLTPLNQASVSGSPYARCR